jgi:chemotaxis protein CheZ
VRLQIMQELASLRDMVAWSKRELAVLVSSENNSQPLPRAADELKAAIAGMENATINILHAAESADEAARSLSANLRDDYKRGLANDIQDQVVKIYEACNFQDLTGQRINNAIRTLQLVEAQLERLDEIWGGVEDMAQRAKSVSSLINGPKLEGDTGHADQAEIDRMFGSVTAGGSRQNR